MREFSGCTPNTMNSLEKHLEVGCGGGRGRVVWGKQSEFENIWILTLSFPFNISFVLQCFQTSSYLQRKLNKCKAIIAYTFVTLLKRKNEPQPPLEVSDCPLERISKSFLFGRHNEASP